MLLDAASTAGCVPIDMLADNIDLLAFTGHKALLGPTGTGGLVIGPRVDPASIRPIFCGGTGSRSASETQPPMLPDVLECGTLNTAGLAGLGAALTWISLQRVEHIQRTCRALTRMLIDRLAATAGVTVYGPHEANLRTATISFAINRLSPSQAGQLLDERYGVLCRVGLHCAPRAHTTAGTYPHGSIRFSPGVFTTPDEINAATNAVRCLAEEAAS
jgi:cysteine desulfurase/selenocysteine lyase